jgi:hypothetical protein
VPPGFPTLWHPEGPCRVRARYPIEPESVLPPWQAVWSDESPLLFLPHMTAEAVQLLAARGVTGLPQLMALSAERIRDWLRPLLPPPHLTDLTQVSTGAAATQGQERLGPWPRAGRTPLCLARF